MAMKDRVLSLLRGPEAARIRFTVPSASVPVTINRAAFTTVANAIVAGKIGVSPFAATTRALAEYHQPAAPTAPATGQLMVPPILGRIDEAAVMHESTHAFFDLTTSNILATEEEAVSYVVTALYHRMTGLTPTRWTGRSPHFRQGRRRRPAASIPGRCLGRACGGCRPVSDPDARRRDESPPICFPRRPGAARRRGCSAGFWADRSATSTTASARPSRQSDKARAAKLQWHRPAGTRRRWEETGEASPQAVPATGRQRARAARCPEGRCGAGLSGAAGAPGGRFCGRPGDRHPGAPDRAIAGRAVLPAVHRREQAGRRRQHRGRVGRARAGRRLHAAGDRRQQPDQHDALRQARLRPAARLRAGRRHLPRLPGHGGQSRLSGARPSPSSSPTPRPIRARSTSAPPAPARWRTSPASCSR